MARRPNSCTGPLVAIECVVFCWWSASHPVATRNLGGGGANTIGPDATHAPAICQNLRGGGGGGREGGGSIGARLGGGPRGGGLRATHHYHMHTSRVGGGLSGGMGV